MGRITTDVKEVLKLFVKNVTVPEAVKGIYVEKDDVKLIVKPNVIFPEINLKFKVKASNNKILVLFEKKQSAIIYGFLKAYFKDDAAHFVSVSKDSVEVDLEKYLGNVVKGISIGDIFIDDEGKIDIEFSVG